MSRARDRLPELELLRGIAALSVVLYHTLLTLQLHNSIAHRLLNALPTHPIFAGRLAVIFFFVLSGVVLTRGLMNAGGPGPTGRPSIGDWARFAAQRVVRLCLPTAAALAMSSVLYWLLWNGPWPGSGLFGGWSTPPNPTGFVRQALLIGADGQFDLDPALWSLVHELQFSLVLPLLVAVPAFRGLQGSLMLVLAGLLIFALSVAGRSELENTVLLGPTLVETFRATAYFALPFLAGAALSLGHWQRWRPSAEQQRFALATALLLFCSNNDLAAVVASVLLILLSGHPGRFREFLLLPPLLLLGRVSFSLYLVHMPVLLALRHGLHTVLPEAWMEPLTIGVSLLAAWLLHVLAERPALLLSRQIRTLWPPSRRAFIAADPSLRRQT